MKRTVLFLCTGNSCRSQMAEGLVNQHLGDEWQAYSAGINPAGYVHPLAVQVMSELGIDISRQRSKSVDECRGSRFNLVVTVCDDAAENCPVWLGDARMVHVGFQDPARATGTHQERRAIFRRVRDEILREMLNLLANGKRGNQPGHKTKVLFLCSGNSARSQMAEALLKRYAGDRFEVHSAGLEPKSINPFTLRAMAELGYDLSDQRAKDVTEYLGKVHFGYLITVCAHAEEHCPKAFLGVGERIHWPIQDPSAFDGPEEETLEVFRQARDEIAARIEAWLAELGIPTEGRS